MPILNWLRLACMKRGRSTTAAAAQTSTLATDWTVILADQEYLQWTKKRLDGMLDVTPINQPSPGPSPGDTGGGRQMTPGGNIGSPMDAINLQDAFFERLATSFAYMHQQNKTATNTSSGETAKAKGFSHTEKILMLGWCGLGLQTEAEIPEIWAEIHAIRGGQNPEIKLF
eukprot:scaffold49010_cov41-Attheya_sp.AAC.2